MFRFKKFFLIKLITMSSNQQSEHPSKLFCNVIYALSDLFAVISAQDCDQKARNNKQQNDLMMDCDNEVGDYKDWIKRWDKDKFMAALDEEQKALYGDNVEPSEIWFSEKLDEMRKKQQMIINEVDNIHKWLQQMGMERYFETFMNNGYDTFSLIVDFLDKNELNVMKVKRIHQKRILNEIHKLKNNQK